MTASRCIGKSTVVLFLIAVATASPEALAQRAPIKGWTVGILWHAANLEGEMVMYQPFADGMRALGYVEGHNVNFDHTFVDEKYERFPANAQQNPGNQDHPDTLKRAEQAAKQLNIKIVPVSAKGPEEFSDAFSEMKKSKLNGLVVLGDAMFRVNRASIIALAAETRLPAVYAPRDYAESGGLISYGACIPCNFRRTATYIDKILKGAKPGDLPVEQPATFEMVVNLKTAAALGLTIPATLLLVADQVIE
jgi:hypothetical protein